MKMIRQTPVTADRLVSSSIPESEYPAWSSVTIYAAGARAIKSHRVWESTQSSNSNHDPDTAGLSWWRDVGPTNRMAMFDGKVGTASVAATSLTVTISPGRIDALALLNVQAAQAVVTMTLGSQVVYTKTVSLIDDANITSWFQYFFEPIRSKDYVLLTDLPVFGEATITITLSSPGGNVSCGICIAGRTASLGRILSSPSLSINDFSRKITDDFGNTDLVQRSFSKKMGIKLIVENTEIDRVHDILSSQRAVPAVWIGSEKHSSMLIYGFYRDFDIDIAYSKNSYCTLNIEGMI